jgi:hypothetical protein
MTLEVVDYENHEFRWAKENYAVRLLLITLFPNSNCVSTKTFEWKCLTTSDLIRAVKP